MVMKTKVIKNREEYEEILRAIERYMDLDPDPGTPAADQLELLTLLVRDYESKNFPIGAPDPIDAIRFRMDQAHLSQRDLVPYIGSKSKVSEVLSKRRPLTLSMIRALHEGLGIPAKVLLTTGEADRTADNNTLDCSQFPLSIMIKRGWIPASRDDAAARPQPLIEHFLAPVGDPRSVLALYRQSTVVRSARPLDKYALIAWTVRVLTRAIEATSRFSQKAATVNSEFMREVIKLSWFDEGPRLAKEFLEKHGIVVIIEPHLPKTYLDGASMLIPSKKTPVIGMSLRYDRIDNFWYCLMHELAHVSKHLTTNHQAFYDDLDVDKPGDPRELEADEFAVESLIPRDVWAKSPAKAVPSPQAVQRLAKELRIHPGIVAGRIRYERKNFRMLNQFVGHGRVRKLFSEVTWDVA
jgi:HTH-type transcriptional regulator / antitoxin HigA